MTTITLFHYKVDECLEIVRYIESQGAKRNIDFTWEYVPEVWDWDVTQGHRDTFHPKRLVITFINKQSIASLILLKYENRQTR